MKIFLLIVYAALSTSLIFPQNEIDELDYALKGVNRIHLVITIYPNSYPDLGLTKTEIYRDKSYLLRKDGVKVFSNMQTNTPTLSINFMVYEKDINNCDLHIMVGLLQDVTINSNKVKVKANTWTRIFDGRNISYKYQVKEILEDVSKVFVNTLLAINPKN